MLSLLLQIGVMSLLMLIPLIYSETLPSAQLKSVLMAPTAPTPSPTPHLAPTKLRPSAVVRTFVPSALRAPAVIARQVNNIPEAAPVVDVSSVTTGGNGASSDLISSVIGPGTGNAPPVVAPQPKRSRGPVRVGGRVAQANLIERVQPVYPALAKSARVQGAVEFTATISKEGAIENLQLVRGHPLLVNAATEAVLKWRYRPTLLNGEPVEVITDIVVHFTLSP